MQLSVIDPPEATRLERELDLRRRGYVPISSPDALFPSYDGLLPGCCVRQVLPTPRHSRVIWSHPGRSGLDPRAVAPLAVIRVADGWGSDPLDESLSLVAATHWLLDGDVHGWLTRPRHRLLMGQVGEACLLQTGDRGPECLKHLVLDPVLQQVAEVLGDRTMKDCYRRTGPRGACFRWRGAPEGNGRSDLLWSAFGVTGRLGGWYRAGVTGTPAWDLARHGVRVELFSEWERAGFSVEDAAQWCGRGDVQQCVQLREAGVAPVEPVAAVPLPTVDPKRGLTGYDRWQYSRRGWAFEPCALCGATAPSGKRCRTCERQKRTTPLHCSDWSAYQKLAKLGPMFLPSVGVEPVPCGASNCQSPLGSSAVDEGARQ